MRPRAERFLTVYRSARVSWRVLAVVWSVVAVVRFWLVTTGPDVDTDAYGHAVAARAFVVAPRDLSVHWVWLPLWHLVHAAALLRTCWCASPSAHARRGQRTRLRSV